MLNFSLFNSCSNRKSGPNIGTSEAGDMITVHEKTKGGPVKNGPSVLLATLSIGQSYKIENFKASSHDVYIFFESVSTDLKDATIVLSINEVQTASPTESPTCADDPTFEYQGKLGRKCNWVGKGNKENTIKRCNKTHEGGKISDFCLETCGKVGLGSCSDYFPQFDLEDIVPKLPECQDDMFFKYKGNRKKMCENWVARTGTKQKCNIKLKKSGKRIFDHCKKTCAAVGVGFCPQ